MYSRNIVREFCFEQSVREIQDGAMFHKAIIEAKKENPYGEFVYAYSDEEYNKMKLFIMQDGAAGLAIKADGDIVSIFKNPVKCKEYGLKNVGEKLLHKAISEGGIKLDCFAGFLPDFYIQYGFVPVCKTTFDKNYAPSNWDYKRDGEPDVVFMRHNGDALSEVVAKKNKYVKFDNYIIPVVNSYEEGIKYRDAQIVKMQNKGKHFGVEKPLKSVMERCI